MREPATEHFNIGLESMFTVIFERMMKNGSLKKDDPAMLAFAYTTPISSLIQLCDREPDRYKSIIKKKVICGSFYFSIWGIRCYGNEGILV